MKGLFIVILFFLILTSCSDKPDQSIETIFYTQDSLYKITFSKPVELDTFYTWMDEDDNVCSDEHKYRFSKKDFPAQRETGFFWTSFADSSYRLTLKNVEDYRCKSDMDYEKEVSPEEYQKNLIKKAKEENEKIEILFAKADNINNKNFLLCAYRLNEGYKNGYPTNYLKALTTLDSNLLVFIADCRAKDCNGFIDRMGKSLRTLKIEKVE